MKHAAACPPLGTCGLLQPAGSRSSAAFVRHAAAAGSLQLTCRQVHTSGVRRSKSPPHPVCPTTAHTWKRTRTQKHTYKRTNACAAARPTPPRCQVSKDSSGHYTLDKAYGGEGCLPSQRSRPASWGRIDVRNQQINNRLYLRKQAENATYFFLRCVAARLGWPTARRVALGHAPAHAGNG
jgi:hypothetical protein